MKQLSVSSSSTYISLSVLLTIIISRSASSPDRYLKSSEPSINSTSQTYFEVTLPSPSDYLSPSCTHTILSHSFANTINSPPTTVAYSPPSCDPPYFHIALQLNATCRGDQYDRIAAVWLGGVELLRTSTAEPTEDGIFWSFLKDVTRYSSLFNKPSLVTIMLENVVNDVYTGVYHVNVSLLFYQDIAIRVPLANSVKLEENLAQVVWNNGQQYNIGENPADLVLPVSDEDGVWKGYWFKIENGTNLETKMVKIPTNVRRATLELCVSFHGNDEFWYSNPPDNYIKMNNLTTGRGGGAFREVYVMIDGQFVGSVIPFPVVFTGGINPLFWELVVGIGAFDLPSYDLDLTPFLGILLDGEYHSFGIGISNGISFWLVNANLHLWMDQTTSDVQAQPVSFRVPSFSLRRKSKFKLLDGMFRVQARRKSQFTGWVNTTMGNLTTTFTQKFRLNNSIKFQKNGTRKSVKQQVRVNTELKIASPGGLLLIRAMWRRAYPLTLISTTDPTGPDSYVVTTKLKRSFTERFTGGYFTSQVSNIQQSQGWMAVKDHDVVAGEASTKQTLSYRGELGCFFRNVVAANSKLVSDNSTATCLGSS